MLVSQLRDLQSRMRNAQSAPELIAVRDTLHILTPVWNAEIARIQNEWNAMSPTAFRILLEHEGRWADLMENAVRAYMIGGKIYTMADLNAASPIMAAARILMEDLNSIYVYSFHCRPYHPLTGKVREYLAISGQISRVIEAWVEKEMRKCALPPLG